MKLLIVEDSLSVRRILRSLVEPFAGEIEECGDGREAVSRYAAGRHDLVLMDIALGQLDGISATKEIRAGDPQARIIIVTNYDEDDLREEALKAGAGGYVLKDNLFEVLRYF